MLKRKGVQTRLTFTTDDIIGAAKNSLATTSPAKELILKGKMDTLQHLQNRRDKLTAALTDYCRAMMLEGLGKISKRGNRHRRRSSGCRRLR